MLYCCFDRVSWARRHLRATALYKGGRERFYKWVMICNAAHLWSRHAMQCYRKHFLHLWPLDGDISTGHREDAVCTAKGITIIAIDSKRRYCGQTDNRLPFIYSYIGWQSSTGSVVNKCRTHFPTMTTMRRDGPITTKSMAFRGH